jgi:hypothetical protein
MEPAHPKREQAMVEAVKNYRLEILKLLLSVNNDINTPSVNGTVVSQAIEGRASDALKILLANGNKMQNQDGLLVKAVRSGSSSSLKALLASQIGTNTDIEEAKKVSEQIVRKDLVEILS